MNLELKIPPPVVALVMAALMWACRDVFDSLNMELANRLPISLLLTALGLLVDASALWLFFRVRTTINPIKPSNASALVIKGIYQYTRNPMYAGNFIFLIAWLLWLGSPLNILFLVAYVLYMNRFQISVEEKILHDKFGEEYVLYCQKVRRWV